jgi:hypothetical protein
LLGYDGSEERLPDRERLVDLRRALKLGAGCPLANNLRGSHRRLA